MLAHDDTITAHDLCHCAHVDEHAAKALELAEYSFNSADDIACLGHSAVQEAWWATRLCLKDGCRCGVDLRSFRKIEDALNMLESEEC